MKQITIATTAFAVLLLPQIALACPEGARCMTAPTASDPLFVPGDYLEPGTFNILMNSDYHDLPKAGDGYWYVTIDRRVLRIRASSYEVVEDVTLQARRVF